MSESKARKADRDTAAGAPSHNSNQDWEDEDYYVDTTTTPAHRPGPMETKLRAKPEPIALCFGAYGEASQGVHDLIKVVAEEMAEERLS